MSYLSDPRVPAILERIRNNPPQIRVIKVPSRSCLFGRDDYAAYYGDDVSALSAINNEWFLAAEGAGGTKGARDYLESAPDVQVVVERVLAGEL